ncbi:TrbC/VirB2 family protein [Salmonella enterica]|nr:conjugal transfer protein TraM [Salmonella enterica]EEC4048972.1 conjugal transfer protein TraM [Salmonella enterica]EFT2498090.1 TrbC/VirB2 family protein [Salmonella enterica]EJV8112406.1 TrbC/VirB2 family protein [Salmonella enterica]EJZ3940221.1 TrbC/VirB2 family protein [Salmonella enterica]
MNTAIKRFFPVAMFMLVALCVPELALAAGADTGESSMNSVNSWMMTWIPIGATILIIASALAWIAHMLPASWAIRIVVGLIVVGSASYLVGLFGLN